MAFLTSIVLRQEMKWDQVLKAVGCQAIDVGAFPNTL